MNRDDVTAMNPLVGPSSDETMRRTADALSFFSATLEEHGEVGWSEAEARGLTLVLDAAAAALRFEAWQAEQSREMSFGLRPAA